MSGSGVGDEEGVEERRSRWGLLKHVRSKMGRDSSLRLSGRGRKHRRWPREQKDIILSAKQLINIGISSIIWRPISTSCVP